MIQTTSIYNQQQYLYHSPPNRVPTPKAAPADTAPMIMVSAQEMYHLAVVTKLLLKPKTNRKNTATAMVVQEKVTVSSMLLILAMMMGIRGISPKMQKLKKVTRLLRKGFSQSAISFSSSIIMTFRKPSLFSLKISTISVATGGSRPMSVQIWTISFFSAQKSVSISCLSRSSSAFMYSASLLVARQSATPMEMASPIREDKPSAKMTPASSLAPSPDRATQRVVMMPSKPPYTADLMNSPALMCFYQVTCTPSSWSSIQFPDWLIVSNLLWLHLIILVDKYPTERFFIPKAKIRYNRVFFWRTREAFEFYD